MVFGLRFMKAAITASIILVFPHSAMVAYSASDQEARSVVPPSSQGASATHDALDRFGAVFEQIRARHVDPTSGQRLIEAAISGMLKSLDPHSGYLDRLAYQDMKVRTRGEFGGVGIEVTMQDDGLIRISTAADGMPAARAGLGAGDVITHLDGRPLKGLSLAEAVNLMRGPAGAPVEVTVMRSTDGASVNVTLTREIVRRASVYSRREGDVGYIQITSFTRQTQPGLEAAIAALQNQIGTRLIGFVLDLRGNPGGLVQQAVSVVDSFLDQGEIVSTRGRGPSRNHRYSATPGDLTHGLPLVVLINSGSASASEIVAGALQDHGRAILLGGQSFGKGSVQTIIPLPGYGAIKMTTSRYYTPSGRSIQGLGITPDVVVQQVRVRPRTEKTSGQPDIAPVDHQLERALDILRGAALFGTANFGRQAARS